jgi:hypothetical protein
MSRINPSDWISWSKTCRQLSKCAAGTSGVEFQGGISRPQWPHVEAAAVRGRHRRQRQSGWLCLVERILGDWAPTLRLAVLLIIILAALIAAIAVLLGFGSALMMLGGAAAMKMLSAHPVRAIRT